MEPLWKDTQLAEFLGVDVKTLERWRRDGTGPPFVRAGRQVRYDPQRVRAWLEERTTTPA